MYKYIHTNNTVHVTRALHHSIPGKRSKQATHPCPAEPEKTQTAADVAVLDAEEQERSDDREAWRSSLVECDALPMDDKGYVTATIRGTNRKIGP